MLLLVNLLCEQTDMNVTKLKKKRTISDFYSRPDVVVPCVQVNSEL